MQHDSESLSDYHFRSELKPGDIGEVVRQHGFYYTEQYGYGIPFEAYVAQGLYEFYMAYDPLRDKVWICESGNTLLGFLLLMHRKESSAQLRFFYLHPDARGKGIGNRLMKQFMEELKLKGYQHCFLWTTSELTAAAHLYKKYGFMLTEERPSSTFGKPVTEQTYEWHAPLQNS